jgi:ferredoxin-type protein NapH
MKFLWLRRFVQGGALALLLAVPALNYGGILYQQYGKNGYHKASLMGTVFEQWLYRLFSVTVGELSDPVARSISLVGNFGSFSLFGFSILDPVVAAEALLRIPTAWAALLAGVAVPLLLALVFGRVFCGWICPVNTLLEGFDLLRRRALPKIGIRPLDFSVPRWTKWVLFFVGIAAALVGNLALWANLLPHVLIGRDVFSLMVFGATSGGVLILAAIILAELLLSRRVWCRSVCPTGAVLGLFGARAPMRVRKAEEPCLDSCSACVRICPMGLNPARPFSLSECYSCGVCVSACPADLLTMGFLHPRELSPAGLLPHLKRLAGFLLGAALLFLPAVAFAHHMRGQPHYGYAENYPQIPTRETRVRIGSYDVTVVSYFFEGLRRNRSNTPDDVQFYVSLTDSRTNQSYMGPLSIEILHGGQRIAAFDHDRPFEEAVYRVRQAIPGRGRYELRLAATNVQGTLFVDVVGDLSSWMPYWATGGVILFALILFLNRRRIRAARRRRPRVASGA